jgi:hypothetical protein
MQWAKHRGGGFTDLFQLCFRQQILKLLVHTTQVVHLHAVVGSIGGCGWILRCTVGVGPTNTTCTCVLCVQQHSQQCICRNRMRTSQRYLVHVERKLGRAPVTTSSHPNSAANICKGLTVWREAGMGPGHMREWCSGRQPTGLPNLVQSVDC